MEGSSASLQGTNAPQKPGCLSVSLCSFVFFFWRCSVKKVFNQEPTMQSLSSKSSVHKCILIVYLLCAGNWGINMGYLSSSVNSRSSPVKWVSLLPSLDKRRAPWRLGGFLKATSSSWQHGNGQTTIFKHGASPGENCPGVKHSPK